MKKSNLLTLFTFLLFGVACSASAKNIATEKYKWNNVTITGGGFVDGIIFHPTEKNLRYARTDMG
ncbi:MAG TPA: hypothetical protein VJ909_06265, partial [Prolixibacteraceae bacterium]|nr:hypothetical protein [Prolixibacteraceae bacterium]